MELRLDWPFFQWRQVLTAVVDVLVVVAVQ
jgi:hypothetical protein